MMEGGDFRVELESLDVFLMDIERKLPSEDLSEYSVETQELRNG